MKIPDYADVMPLDVFQSCVHDGVLIPYDGDGNYVIGDDMTNVSVWGNEPPEGTTHVAWYNK